MSHFVVAVIHKEDQYVDEMLAPYSEYIEVAPYVSRTKKEIINKGWERRKWVEDNQEALIKRGEGEMPEYWQEYLNAKTDEEMYFVETYEDMLHDDEGNELSTYNPNAKYDWYVIGGRWPGMLKAKKGYHGEGSAFEPNPKKDGFYDSAKIKDIDFSRDENIYKEAKRFWEVVIEKAPLRENESKNSFYTYYNEQYYKDKYGDKESYAKTVASFSTRAVLTSDGIWHEPGEMGWFGMSSESPEEAKKWEEEYWERFIKNADPEMYITIVDCHI